MRFSILAVGTRGDVQPFVALALGLGAAGHQVRIAADPLFESFVRRQGVDFWPVLTEVQTLMQGETARRFLEQSSTTVAAWRALARQAGPTMARRYEDCWRASQGADVVIASPLALSVGHAVAEKLRRALFSVAFAPIAPPVIAVSQSRLRTWGQDARAHLVWSIFRRATNAARRDVLGLPALPLIRPGAQLQTQGWSVLCQYSAHVGPPHRPSRQPIHVTGYWFLTDGGAWQPPAALDRFLADGPPPVYVGFGSMPLRSPEATIRLAIEALARAGQRGVLATGWGLAGKFEALRAPHVYVVDEAPHDWLFPRMSAVVHHGGAGTLGAAFCAGVPSVVVPFGVPDQQFWARRVHELGVGPAPIPRRALTLDRLSDAIRIATRNDQIRGRAASLGERIRSEDGVARAVEILSHARES